MEQSGSSVDKLPVPSRSLPVRSLVSALVYSVPTDKDRQTQDWVEGDSNSLVWGKSNPFSSFEEMRTMQRMIGTDDKFLLFRGQGGPTCLG